MLDLDTTATIGRIMGLGINSPARYLALWQYYDSEFSRPSNDSEHFRDPIPENWVTNTPYTNIS